MNRRTGIAFAAAVLGLGLWSMTASSGPPAGDIKEAQDAVLKLMESMNGKKGNVKAQTAAIKKKFVALEPIMYAYKPRAKGGVGMKDGRSIEIELAKIGNAKAKGWTAKKRLEARNELVRAAKLSRTIAEVSDLYANQYNDNNTGKPNPAKWKEFVEKMRKDADELEKAAKGDDAVKIQKAAENLSAGCTECHAVFR